MALLRGRDRAVPQDVYDVAYDILNARLALSYRATAEGFTIDDVLVELLTTVPAPGLTNRPPLVPGAPAIPTPSAAQTPAFPTQVASSSADTVVYVNAAPQTQARQPMPGPVTAVGTPWGVPAPTPPIVLPGDPPVAR
jgi:hypothetical protein